MRTREHTIKNVVSCLGVGVHSGLTTSLSLYPASSGSGIAFVRTDVKSSGNKVLARYDQVKKTMLGTTISNNEGVEVYTIEHLMAALYGYGIDNVTVEIDGPEVPIMDGSALPFIKMLECAGTRAQAAPRKFIEVLKEVCVEDGDAHIKIMPSQAFKATARIQFDQVPELSQEFTFSSCQSFKDELAKARTFGFKHMEAALKNKGLAQGASLENVIVIDGNTILNKEGLRYDDELVRHKLLDLLGDFYLAGHPIRGEVEAFKPGHTINNKVVRALLQDTSAYRLCA
jgi:UDP-3-O-[3-hydroxymyristoyl] N-acetylglucosamine deacetylase